jgi:3-hydroxy-3-methylglutaryl CoA synthase
MFTKHLITDWAEFAIAVSKEGKDFAESIAVIVGANYNLQSAEQVQATWCATAAIQIEISSSKNSMIIDVHVAASDVD